MIVHSGPLEAVCVHECLATCDNRQWRNSQPSNPTRKWRRPNSKCAEVCGKVAEHRVEPARACGKSLLENPTGESLGHLSLRRSPAPPNGYGRLSPAGRCGHPSQTPGNTGYLRETRMRLAHVLGRCWRCCCEDQILHQVFLVPQRLTHFQNCQSQKNSEKDPFRIQVVLRWCS